MAFLRKFTTIINKSDKEIYKIDSEDGINLSSYDINFNIIYSKKIIKGDYSFVDYWFDITSSNKLYGIINNKIDSLIYFHITDKIMIKNIFIKYNSKSTYIKFLYIKELKKSTHIIYYELDKLNPYNVKLMHYYKDDNTWRKYLIDSFSYKILTNFVITYDNTISPSIFYYKLDNGFEELFVSTFNIQLCKWSEPIKITNSKKDKIYLSVIKDSLNNYHILYSENNFGKYYCNYISGYIKNNKFITKYNLILSDSVACNFPNIIEYNNKIYAAWIEYNNLYITESKTFGFIWQKSSLVENCSTSPFVCCNYHSNKYTDNKFNYFTLFMIDNSLEILGIK